MTAALGREIAGHGLRLEPAGEASLSLLPLPRIRLSRLAVTDGSGAPLVADAAVTAELRILPLLAGRASPSEIAVSGARVGMGAGRIGGGSWRASLQAAARIATAQADAPRIVLRDVSVFGDLRGGAPALATELDLAISARDANGELDATGSGLWRGRKVRAHLRGLDPADVGSGAPDALAISVVSDLGSIRARGEVRWDAGEPRFAGHLAVAATSLDEALRWLGVSDATPGLRRPVSIEGAATANASEFGWTTASVRIGENAGEGSVSVGWAAERPLVRGTLAAGDVDLGWVADRLWRDVDVQTRRHPTLADYDLRLSAGRMRLGPLQLTDAAAAILIGRDRFELSLARAGLAGGQVKGRLAVAFEEDGLCGLRGQLSADRVDVATLLREAGAVQAATGRLTAQASFDAEGRGRASLVQALHGRAFVSAQSGEWALLDRFLREPAPAARLAGLGDGVAGPGGRATFDAAYVNLTLADGIASIADGEVAAGSLRTGLAGRASLVDGTATLRTTTTSAGDHEVDEHPPFVVQESGRLDRLFGRPGAPPRAQR